MTMKKTIKEDKDPETKRLVGGVYVVDVRNTETGATRTHVLKITAREQSASLKAEVAIQHAIALDLEARRARHFPGTG